MLIKCPHCMKIHDKYVDCEEKKQHKRRKRKQYENTDNMKLYDKYYKTSRWNKVRKLKLQEENYLCEICRYSLKKYNCEDIQVHHIVKIKDNSGLAYDLDNLVVLCRYHHNIVEDMTRDEIIEYANRLKENPLYRA